MDDAESFQSSMSSESVYEVESILDSRDQDGRTEYRVRWKGWESKWDTWEPIENLLSCQELLTSFHLARQVQSPPVSPPVEEQLEEEAPPSPPTKPRGGGKKRGQPRKGRPLTLEATDEQFVRPRGGRGSRAGRPRKKAPDGIEDEAEKPVRGGGRGGRRGRGRGGRGGARSRARVSSTDEEEKEEVAKSKGGRRSTRSGRVNAEKESSVLEAETEMDVADEETTQPVPQGSVTTPESTPPDAPPPAVTALPVVPPVLERGQLVVQQSAQATRAPPGDTLSQTRQQRRLEKEAEATKTLGLSFENDINEFRKNQMREYQRLDTMEAQCLSREAFIDAVKCADLKALRKAFAAMKQRKEKMERGLLTAEGETMLVAATKLVCEKSHSADDVIEMLVQNGADVNERGRGGRTALHYAAERGFLCKISKLLSLGAHVNVCTDVDASPTSCETPLFIACRKGFAHCAYRLLEYGADCGAINGHGDDLLSVANKSRSQQTLDLLTRHIEKLKLCFEGELQLLFPQGATLKIKHALFPHVRCFPLGETSEVKCAFTNRVPIYANSHNRIGFLLCMGVAKLTQQVSVRFWGPSPILSVFLNGVELQSMQENSNFVMHMKSLVPGGNELVIKLSPQAAKSQMRLVVQAFLVSMPVDEARRLANDAVEVGRG